MANRIKAAFRKAKSEQAIKEEAERLAASLTEKEAKKILPYVKNMQRELSAATGWPFFFTLKESGFINNYEHDPFWRSVSIFVGEKHGFLLLREKNVEELYSVRIELDRNFFQQPDCITEMEKNTLNAIERTEKSYEYVAVSFLNYKKRRNA